MKKEIWKKIKNRPDYSVSNFGRVKSFVGKPKILKGTLSLGYKSIHFREKIVRVHRLVAEQFISNIANKEMINHKDGVKTNNNVENLEWCTAKENVQHAYKNGLMKGLRGEDSPVSRLTKEQVFKIRRMKKNHTLSELGIIFNTHRTNIWHIVNKKTWNID